MNQPCRARRLFLLWLGLSMVAIPMAHGQSPPPMGNGPPAPAVTLPQGQLDALLAPIALYPDQLLAQILMASTYPLEVVAAARFVQENPALVGATLDQALQDKTWDPSVLSLTAFPQVLSMMNDRLDWMQQLGDAFLANSQQVMDAVQSLRYRAAATGNLQGSPEQTVIGEDGALVIEPTQPDDIYVPAYDPREVYGPWSDPAYMPWDWLPPPFYGYPAFATAGIVFGTAVVVTSNHWGWAYPNWRHHSIDVNVGRNVFASRPHYRDAWPGGQWEHLPEHRHGVAYRNDATRDRYARTSDSAIEARQPYRGREIARPPQQAAPAAATAQPTSGRSPQQSYGRSLPPSQPSMARSMPVPQQRAATMAQRPPPSPAYYPQPRAQVQMDADRGHASRQSIGARNTSPQEVHR